MSAQVEQVRAELRTDTEFVATDRLRLSWTVVTTEPNWRQAAADLRCGNEQVRLDGDASVLVEWPFVPLAPGDEREVQVRVIAESGTGTGWSSPLSVRAGFLGPGAWVAQPIGLAEPSRVAQPVLLRRAFSIDRPVRRALLFYTALGAAELEINGSRVDDDVLSPGWTSYQDRLVHETVDVTALLRPGDNVLGGWLAGAWYTEKYGFGGLASRTYGEQPRLLAQLQLDFGDGDVTTIATDGSWQITGDGPLVESGIYGGEQYDARLAHAGWSTPGSDDAGWTAADVSPEPVPVPEARIGPPVRRIEEVPVASVLTSLSGALILDFGQNLVGWLRIRLTGPAGTTIALRHAEVLEDGELCLRPLRQAAATDSYVPSGNGRSGAWHRFSGRGPR